MVKSERIKRAETEEELKEALMEREALRSALQLLESENGRLRRSASFEPSHSRSSSVRGIKSLSPRPLSPNSDTVPDEIQAISNAQSPEHVVHTSDPGPVTFTDTHSRPVAISIESSIPIEESPWADAVAQGPAQRTSLLATSDRFG